MEINRQATKKGKNY